MGVFKNYHQDAVRKEDSIFFPGGKAPGVRRTGKGEVDEAPLYPN